MIRDQNPNRHIGFGVSEGDIPNSEQSGPNPTGSVIARKLHDDPIMRFLAVSAATVVGMKVGGAIVRKGGIRLGYQMERSTLPIAQRATSRYRKAQELLDTYQGVKRVIAEGNEDGRYLFFRGQDDKIRTGSRIDTQIDGFHIRREEILEARRQGWETPSPWRLQDEFQQRLISEARRAPYELPAAYVMQRAVIDPVFGNSEPPEKKVNWANPVDVITDFVKQSTIQTATLLLPMELGAGGAKHGWSRFMTYGDDALLSGAHESQIRTASIGLQTLLERIGHDSSRLIQEAVKHSGKNAGAMSVAIQESKANNIGVVEFLHQKRRGIKAYNEELIKQNLSLSKRSLNLGKFFFGEKSGGYALDQLPSQLKGAQTGIRAFRSARDEIERGYSVLDDLMTGKRLWKDIEADQPSIAALQRVSGHHSVIEEVSSKLASYGSKTGNIKDGLFYQQQFSQEYQRQLVKRLQVDHGLSDQAAADFVKQFKVHSIDSTGKASLSNRLRQGGQVVHEAGSDKLFYQALRDRTALMPAFDAKVISSKLGEAVRATDDLFGSKKFRKDLDSSIKRRWDSIEQVTVPGQMATNLRRGKMPYEQFTGKLSPDDHGLMVRMAANKLSISNVDPLTGVRIPDTILMDRLREFGLAPANPGNLRGFLIQKGAISKPWHSEGFNVFGLRALSVDRALDKDFFKTSGQDSENIKNFVGRMKSVDPLASKNGSYTLGGVFETSSGRIVDLSALRYRAQKFSDSVAANIQIPFIHLKPFEAAGHNVRRDARERSILEISSGITDQKFLSGGSFNSQAEAYVWMKTKRGRGKVTRIGTKADGSVESSLLPFEYKPAQADPFRIMGRNLRLAVGDSGRTPLGGITEPRTKFGKTIDRVAGDGASHSLKRFFNVDDYQPDSLLGAAKRFKNRQIDINNPRTMMKLVQKGEVNTKKGSLRLESDGAVSLNGKQINTPAEMAAAFDDATKKLKRFSQAPGLVRELEADESLRPLFGFKPSSDLKGTGIKIDDDNFAMLSKQKTNAQILNYGEALSKDIKGILPDLDDESQKTLRSALKSYVEDPIHKSTDSAYWDRMLPQSAQSATVSTRIDQLKDNIYKLLSVREEVVSQGSFNTAMPKLITKLDDLKHRGAITKAQYTEAQTALLSMQIDHMNYRSFNISSSSITNRLNTINEVRNNPQSRKLVDTYLTQHFDTSASAVKDYGIAAARRRFGFADYSYGGVQYNPFGDTNTVFVPTFGTAVERSGAKAFASVLGLNTWSNPNAFSGASVPVSHLFSRLNKPLGTLGLGLDMTRYKGPLDYYARGIVGQRVLPAFAAGTGLLTADRVAGGMLNEKDDNGNRVYSPYVLGALAGVGVQAQALGSGIMPGGMNYEQKKEQLLEGEVAVRQGRYWALGNSPWAGGKIQYYRPSWYRRLQGAPQYTDQTFGSPLERLAYGYDFSPLRPLDPYHYERKTAEERPYPVTGDYFTGPWGPVAPFLNMTLGKVLKPERQMHSDALNQSLVNYQQIGEGGMYSGSGLGINNSVTGGQGLAVMDGVVKDRNILGSISTGSFTTSEFGRFGSVGNSNIEASNQSLIQAGSAPLQGAKRTTLATIGSTNERIMEAAYQPGTVRPTVVPMAAPVSRNSINYQAGELGYRVQEMAGIYGFAFGSARDYLGYGSQDLSGSRPVLQSSTYAFGSSRGFWDLNIGGAGDLPLPIEGNYANLEFSEVARRFIPKERTDVNYINPLPNKMGIEHPWLPGPGNITDFTHGDPYSIQEGVMRLPGDAYERFNNLHSDKFGRYGIVDQHKILGDIAPYSEQYKLIDRAVDGMPEADQFRAQIETTRAQVAAKSKRYEFSPYEYKESSAGEMGMHRYHFAAMRTVEQLKHAGTYFNTKFAPYHTAVENWEREHVYGATFPRWSSPVEDFIKPMIQQNAQRDPLLAGLALGTVGSLFGANPRTKAVTGTIGAITGFVSASYIQGKQFITGERHIPESRLKQLAVEENADILSFVKYQKLANEAQMAGDSQMAAEYTRKTRSTMYGADLNSLNPVELIQAIPKRKREHFVEMLQSPESERERILSTAPRLERRIFQAAWGMPVEKRPDLVDYFQDHELPAANSEVWHPNTSIDDIKIKVAQSLGVDLAQMGYYPQQISEANLINPAYPDYNQGTSEAEIRQFLRANNVEADITPIRHASGNGSISLSYGV